MVYMLEMGSIEHSIAKQAMRAGEPVPDKIQNAPQLLGPHLEMYLQAFFDLDSERAHLFSPTAIPFSKIAEYGKLYDFDQEEMDELIFFVKQMDSAHLKRLDSKSK